MRTSPIVAGFAVAAALSAGCRAPQPARTADGSLRWEVPTPSGSAAPAPAMEWLEQAQSAHAASVTVYEQGDAEGASALASAALISAPADVDHHPVAQVARRELELVVAFCDAHSGDPAQGLAEMERLEADGVEPSRMVGPRAVALDRAGETGRAAAAYAEWAESTGADTLVAAYARSRIRQLHGGPGQATAAAPASELRDPGGLVVPLRGRFGPLAEVWVAAARAYGDQPIVLEAADTKAARHLSIAIAAGVEHPVAVPGVAKLHDSAIALGESESGRGAAVPLGERVSLLAELGAGWVVLAPDGAYGDAAVAASGNARAIRYPTATTSFAPLLRKLGKADTVAVFDTAERTDLILREAARLGMSPRWLVTAEGLDRARLRRRATLWSGVVVAPSVWFEPGDAPRTRRYRAREGRDPGAAALLVWRALDRAHGAPAPKPRAFRVEGADLVTP